MLTPTHIQVAVLRTKELIFKGKNGTNDAFIIYSVGKEKYQSSVKEKASDPVLVWNEGCDISIPSSNGNKTELVLKVMCKASMGDKFLGRVALPLSDFDPTAKAKAIWYPLKPKPGSEKDTKYRGEIEVRISFLIKSIPLDSSSNNLSEKSKRSGSFKSSLGSILSLGKSKKKKKDKTSKESLASNNNNSTDSLPRSNGNFSSSRLNLNNTLPVINDDPGVISEDDDEAPMEFKVTRRKKSTQSSNGSEASVSISEKLNTPTTSVPSTPKNQQKSGFQDIFNDSPKASPKTSPKAIPARLPKNTDVVDDNNYSSSSSPSPKPRTMRLPSVIVEEPPVLSSISQNEDSQDFEESTKTNPSTAGASSYAYAQTLPRKALPPQKLTVSASMSNLVDAGNNGKGSVRKTIKSMFSSSKHLSVDEIFPPSPNNNMKRKDSLRDLGIPKETFKQYERKSKEELVAMIVNLQSTENKQKQKISDLEDYIDKLLLRVLDNMPGLLGKGSNILQLGKEDESKPV